MHERKVINIRLDDSRRDTMEGTVVKTQEDPEMLELEQRVMKAVIDESKGEQAKQDAEMQDMHKIIVNDAAGPTNAPPPTRARPASANSSSSSSISSGALSSTTPRRRGRPPNRRTRRRQRNKCQSPRRDSPSRRPPAKQAPSRAPSVLSVVPERLPTCRTKIVRRYTGDISEAIEHIFLDFDKIVRGFPQDQVRVNSPIICAHSQKARMAMLRHLDRLIDRCLRNFEENNSFYIRPTPFPPKPMSCTFVC